jgi:hypothetical protein
MDVRIVKRVLEYQKGYFCEWDVFYSPNTLFSREKRDTIGGTRNAPGWNRLFIKLK